MKNVTQEFENWIQENAPVGSGVSVGFTDDWGRRYVVPLDFLEDLLWEAFENRHLNIDQLYTDLAQSTEEAGALYRQLQELMEEIE